MAGSHLFFVGSYASENAASICLWELQKSTGRLKKLNAQSGFLNPSYLAINRKNLYAVSEGTDSGEVLAFRFDQEGRPLLLNRLSVMGKAPCHLAVNSGKNLLVAANYMSGDLSVFLLEEDGGLKRLAGVFSQLLSAEERPARDAHAHFVLFCDESDKLLATDLGLDTVFVYRIDPRTGVLSELEQARASFPQGSGPRHLVSHPGKSDLFYVLCEQSSEIYTLEFGVRAKVLQCVSTVPPPTAVQNFAAAIRISLDGKFLYASNRGFDSIAVYNIRTDGLLQLVDIIKLNGSWPRDFCLFDDFAVVAYQKSDRLEVFAIDSNTGLLHERNITAEAVTPVCVCPVP